MTDEMTGRQMWRVLNKSAAYVGDRPGTVKFEPDASIIKDWTRDNDYGGVVFHIGVKELVDDPDKSYPIGEAMVPIVGFFHEVAGHGGQIRQEFEKDTPLSRVLALNYYACKESNEYYGCRGDIATERYFRQPHEIAAQYAGIREAHTFLSDTYGREDADNMIREYVKHRVSLGSEFVDRARDDGSVDDILSDFDKAFKRNVSRHRGYDKAFGQGDVLHAYEASSGKKGLVDAMRSCRSGIKQDSMMAVAYLMEEDKNHRVSGRPVFLGMKLSHDRAFGRFKPPISPMPRKSDLNLRDLGRLGDLIDRDGPGTGPPMELE